MLQRLLFGLVRQQAADGSHAEERRRSGHLAQALQVSDSNLVHELLASMVLSEAVYKKDDEEVREFVQIANGLLPWQEPGNKITELQFSSEWASQRCVVTESGGGLFVCFRGTKVQRDFLTDLNVFFDPVFDTEEDEDPSRTSSSRRVSKWETPCAHRGFLFRAKAVPVIWFYKIAKRKGLRLVFTGHSLGGAVATLATLRLLHWIEKEKGKQIPKPNVACISFAAPAIGNLALQKYVAAQRWDTSIYNYTLKEDFVPILMQPQRLLRSRWRSKNKRDVSGSPASDEQQTSTQNLDIEGGSGSVSVSDPSSQKSEENPLEAVTDGAVQPGKEGRAQDKNGTNKEEIGATADEGKKNGSGRYYQMVKFAVRLRRMVPITISNGKSNGDAKLANTFAYIGRQLTVLDDKVIPASLKHEVLKEYEKLSEDVGEGVPRDSVSSTRWNLMKWATQSFESHRMYTYRDKILAACGLTKAESNPDSLQVLLTSNVLPRIELNFGTVRLCKPLDSVKRRDSASVHITLAGKNLTSCKTFHMSAAEKGRVWKIEKFFSSKLDRDRVSVWTRMRFPEKLTFWDKAFQESEEIYQLLLQVQLGSALRWEDMILKPIEAICKSDFQEESSSLVLVPIHVRLSGRQLGYTRTIYELLQHYTDLSLAADHPDFDPSDSSFAGNHDNQNGGFDHRSTKQQQKVIDYSVLNSFDVIRSMIMISRPAVTVEETSDMIVFVDTLDSWQFNTPSVPYQLRKAFKLGIESFIVLLNNTQMEEPPQEMALEIEAKAKNAGFTNVMFMNDKASQRVLLGTSYAFSPMTLYHTFSRQGYRNSIRNLAEDEELNEQIEDIRAMIHASASISMNPSPLMLNKISIQ